MPAIQSFKDDWTPAKIKDRLAWRAKMYAPEAVSAKFLETSKPVVALAEPAAPAPLQKVEPSGPVRGRLMGWGPDVPNIGAITVKDIQSAVCAVFNLSRNELISPRRQAGIVYPRQIAFFLCRKFTKHSLPEIGRRFGGKDHTTVMHAVRRVEPVYRKIEDMAGGKQLIELVCLMKTAWHEYYEPFDTARREAARQKARQKAILRYRRILEKLEGAQ